MMILLMLCCTHFGSHIPRAFSNDSFTVSDREPPQYSPADSSVSEYPKGISLMSSYSQNISSFSSSRNFEVSLGVGYNITSLSMIALRIFTGTSHLSEQHLDGRFGVGGGALEYTQRLFAPSALRPAITVGYERLTLLQSGSGLNGEGFRLQLGVEYIATQHLALRADGSFRYRRYADMIVGGENIGVIRPVFERVYGLSVGVSINFNISP